MKLYGAVMMLLAIAGCGWLWYQNQQQNSADGRAGRAYVEDETGQRIETDGTRSQGRTRVEAMAKPVGSDEPLLSKFELVERSGVPVSSDELLGQPYVAGFFFSTCPSICVRQNTKVQDLQTEFRGQAIRLLSISCDPEVDQPEVLAEYAKRFDADPEQWLFLTGTMDYIRRVGAEIFRLGVVRRGHPEKFALMDAEGKMVGLYTWSDEGQFAALVQDIEALLASGGVMENPDGPADAEGDTEEENAAGEDG